MSLDNALTRVERFEYTPLGEELALVRLLAELTDRPQAPVDGALVVIREDGCSSHPGRACRIEQSPSGLLWRASFAAPLAIVEFAGAQFQFTTPGRGALLLPAPGLQADAIPDEAELRSGLIPSAYMLRRVATIATVATVTVGYNPALALAAGTGHAHAHHKRAVAALTAVQAGTSAPASATQAQPTVDAASKAHGEAAHAARPVHLFSAPAVHRTHAATEGRSGTKHDSTQQTGSRHDGTKQTGAKHAGSKPTGAKHAGAKHAGTKLTGGKHAGTTHGRHHDSGSGQHGTGTGTGKGSGHPSTGKGTGKGQRGSGTTGKHRAGSRHDHPLTIRHHRHRGHELATHGAKHKHADKPSKLTSTPPASLPQVAPPGVITPTSIAPEAPALARELSRLSELLTNGNQPPLFLVPIYKAAARRYHVPWKVLAAINEIETDYGRNLHTSSAGAIGWMQFMPDTWREWGVATGSRKVADPYNPRDAVFSAARYLAAAGARQNLRKAIFAYNHAQWYVDEVLLTAQTIHGNSGLPTSATAREKVAAMTAMGNLLIGKPYIWGGGHGGWQIVAGYDCSGFVSAVLHAAGYLSEPQTTQTLPSQPDIAEGPGEYVTIFDRTDGGGAASDHVIIDINGHFYESGGSAAQGGGAGVKKLKNPSLEYLATFNQVLHPVGL
jgi:hypothetical protein